MSPAMVIAEFWKHVRPGTALVHCQKVLDVLQAYLDAYRLGSAIDLSELHLEENVGVQEFADAFLDLISKIINRNYVASMAV